MWVSQIFLLLGWIQTNQMILFFEEALELGDPASSW
jgi:hypothetical protein